MVAHPQTLTVQAIPPADAARALAAHMGRDPTGRTDAAALAAMTERGQCFALGGAADAVYVVNVRNGVCWVDAFAGRGPDLVRVLAGLLDQQAAGCRSVAFQTARRGLVRQVQRHGYRITGWILEKDLTQ